MSEGPEYAYVIQEMYDMGDRSMNDLTTFDMESGELRPYKVTGDFSKVTAYKRAMQK